jgi:hypothetical protein
MSTDKKKIEKNEGEILNKIHKILYDQTIMVQLHIKTQPLSK